MRTLPFSVRLSLAATILTSIALGADRAPEPPPVWAYGTDPAAAAIHADSARQPEPETGLKRLPGSGGQFTEAQIQDHFGPADWFPNDHGVMPEVVAHGRKPAIWACALCHYPNGKGKPENASVAGYPAA